MNNEICKTIEDLFTSLIYKNNTDCCKKDSCNKGQYKIANKQPKMPYIGREYGNNPLIPNLLFISLDSGDIKPQYNTIEEIRKFDEDNPPRSNPKKGDKLLHWYQTFEMASLFLDKYFDESIKKEEFYSDKFFAHTNSAKCTQCKDRRAQADRRLFDNCREFVVNEIPLFKADIIITQGNMAWECLGPDLFKKIGESTTLETIHNGQVLKLPIFILDINNKKTLHIPMKHPRNGKYWGQKKAFIDNLDKIVEIINKLNN